jgi:hypothetical protein
MLKKLITLKQINNIVIGMHSVAKKEGDDIVTGDDIVYSNIGDILDIIAIDSDDLPSDFELSKYCYTENDGFYLNPDYVAPQPPIPSLEDEIRKLQAELFLKDSIIEQQSVRIDSTESAIMMLMDITMGM